MPNAVRAASIDELPPGGCLEVTIQDHVVALFNVEGRVYAMDGVCPHAGGPLGKGDLQGDVITCPWHGWQFDVTTGAHCLSPTIQHPCYPVQLEGDEIFVELP